VRDRRLRRRRQSRKTPRTKRFAYVVRRFGLEKLRVARASRRTALGAQTHSYRSYLVVSRYVTPDDVNGDTAIVRDVARDWVENETELDRVEPIACFRIARKTYVAAIIVQRSRTVRVC